ncbi:MAG TPA: hypothetical protein VNS79_09365 [Sphingobium sp.]|nr:hypothetical protein [Sphingobium sp.]
MLGSAFLLHMSKGLGYIRHFRRAADCILIAGAGNAMGDRLAMMVSRGFCRRWACSVA